MTIEVFNGNDGQHYWRLKGANGETMAVSEGFVSRSNATRAANDAVKGIQEGRVTLRNIPDGD